MIVNKILSKSHETMDDIRFRFIKDSHENLKKIHVLKNIKKYHCLNFENQIKNGKGCIHFYQVQIWEPLSYYLILPIEY